MARFPVSLVLAGLFLSTASAQSSLTTAGSVATAHAPVVTVLVPPFADGDLLGSVIDVTPEATTYLVCPGGEEGVACDRANFTIIAGPSTGAVQLAMTEYYVELACDIVTSADSAECTAITTGSFVADGTTSTVDVSETGKFTSLDELTTSITVSAGWEKVTDASGAVPSDADADAVAGGDGDGDGKGAASGLVAGGALVMSGFAALIAGAVLVL